MQTNQKLARIAGVLYLLIAVLAGFSYGFVHTQILSPGDPTQTVKNLLESQGMFRLSFAAGIIAFLCDIAVAAILYVLLKPVSHVLSITAALFRVAQTAILGINMLNLLMALSLYNGTVYPDAFNANQLATLSQVFLTAHQSGFDIAMVFFGIHCALIGYLLIKSELFPNFLGVLLILASLSYLADSFTKFIAPEHGSITAVLVGITAIVAEVTFSLWLVIKGVRKAQV